MTATGLYPAEVIISLANKTARVKMRSKHRTLALVCVAFQIGTNLFLLNPGSKRQEINSDLSFEIHE